MEPTTPQPAIPTRVPPTDAAAPAGPAWMKRVPLITGSLAALAGYLTVRGADLSNNAIYWSNQAVLMQAAASDKWTEYQAASTKARVVEVTLLTLPADAAAARPRLEADAAELRSRQPAIRAEAIALEHKRDDNLSAGQARLREKDLTDYAGVAAQLGIALASIAALTRRPEWFTIAVVVGLAAVGLTAYSLAEHFHLLAHLLHRPIPTTGPTTAP